MKNIINKIVKFGTKHAPELLTGLGVTGIVTTVMFAIKATPKYNLAIDSAIAEKGEELTVKEKAPILAKHYWPTVTMGVATAAMFIGSNYISKNRYGALAAAYSITEKALTDYEKKVEEVAPEVTEKIRREKLEENYSNNCDDIIETGHGPFKCIDMMTGQMFYGDENFIRSVENELNSMLVDGDDVAFDAYIDLLGIRHTSEDYSKGWKNYSDSREKIVLTVGSEKVNGEPVLTVDVEPRPVYNFDY